MIKEQYEKLCLDSESVDQLIEILDKFRSDINEKIRWFFDENWNLVSKNVIEENLKMLAKCNANYESNKWLIDTEIDKIFSVIQENILEVSRVLSSIEGNNQAPDIDSNSDTDSNVVESNRWKNIKTSWVVMYWSPIIPDFADKISDIPAFLGVFNFSFANSWLTLTTVGVSDFNFSKNHEDYPLSTVFVVNPNYSKKWELKSGDNINLTINSKINIAPKILDENNKPYVSFSPDVICSYSAKGRTVEWMYSHDFTEHKDVIRASVSKVIEKVTLTLQTWYDTVYAKMHKYPWYFRFLVNVDCWNFDLWFEKKDNDKYWLQASFIVKDGKVTPTWTFIYSF